MGKEVYFEEGKEVSRQRYTYSSFILCASALLIEGKRKAPAAEAAGAVYFG
ncbi:hypothetical protein [Pontibacter kalidii]|uniref:hypothetical protein n=1 Tax=Pontibacter kalidii TaxID=2592049 RepID=UPI00225C0F34|nr:hypothetical protein [Pontibacter kalidii]